MSNTTHLENMRKIGKALSTDSLIADPKVLPNAMRDLWMDDEYIDLFIAFTSSSSSRMILECIKNMQGTRSEYESQKQLLKQNTYLHEEAAVTVLEGLWALVGKSVPPTHKGSSSNQQRQSRGMETQHGNSFFSEQQQTQRTETHRNIEISHEQYNEVDPNHSTDFGTLYKQAGVFEKLDIDPKSPWYLASIPSVKPALTMKESLIGGFVSFLLYIVFDMIFSSLTYSAQNSLIGTVLEYSKIIVGLFMFYYLCYVIYLSFRKVPTPTGAYESFTAKPLGNGMVACSWKAEPNARYGLAINDKWIALDVSSPCRLELIDKNQPTIILTKNNNRKTILVGFVTIDMR